MDWFVSLIQKSPEIAIIAMLVFILGGLINIAIPIFRKFGVLGDKEPDLAEIMKELQLISSNHLSHLPESEKAIERIENKLDKMNDTLIRIESALTR